MGKRTVVSEMRKEKEKLSLSDIKNLISILKRNGVMEFDLEQNGVRIRIVMGRTDNQKVSESSVVNSTPPPQVIHVVSPGGGQPVVANGLMSGTDSPSPTVTPSDTPVEAKKEEEEKETEHIPIKSPMVGTFYRAPAPDEPPYVEVGDVVNEETVVCIVEAMKVMNEIKAECRGKVAKILVENGQPVEYGQPLFLIEPL